MRAPRAGATICSVSRLIGAMALVVCSVSMYAPSCRARALAVRTAVRRSLERAPISSSSDPSSPAVTRLPASAPGVVPSSVATGSRTASLRRMPEYLKRSRPSLSMTPESCDAARALGWSSSVEAVAMYVGSRRSTTV